MGPGEVYSIFKLNGKEVAAAHALQPQQRQHGVPPHWMNYVAVSNVDEAANKAKSLGASLLAGPFDVMDAGRMAVFQDPTGAAFSVWQAKKHIGIRVKNEVGALGWTELMTTDVDKARDFYVGLFGWTFKEGGHQGMRYLEFSNGGEPQGGIMPLPPGMNAPPNWGPYFVVADCKAKTAQARSAGATIYVDSMDVPNVGPISAIGDPQGAYFSIVQLMSR
jgi:predicted enzyme related to lactoylglutathione lyase